MNIGELEAAALELLPKDRARLAEKLLESLEDPSKQREPLWTDESHGQDVTWNS